MSTRRPPRPHSTFVLVAAVLAVVAFGLAGCEYSSSLDEMRCDDDSECPGDSECSENYCTDPVDELVDTVEIEPDQTTVIEGESAQFEATAVDEDGETVESARITWDSSNSEVLSLDEEEPGRFEANEPGEAIVTASSGGSYGTARVTVEQVPADSVEIEPESLDAIVGDREQLSATVLDEDGEELEDRPVEWDVEDSDIAFVNRDGELRTIGSGTTDVVATSGEASGEMDLTVSEADIGSVSLSPSEVEIVQGDSFELRATVLDSNGELIEDGNMTWESDKEEVATVDDGRVEAVGEGTATITADSEGQTAQAEVTVLPARVDAIDVSPTEMQLQVDREKDLSAQALDSGGNALDWPDLDWTSSDQDILEVVTSNDDSSLNDGEARVEARQTGTARVTVSTERSQAEDEEGSVERSVAVTVINEQPDAMDELTTDPSSATIEIG
ncbi:MAG: Ig-like domain-containing protein, partial [Persicimonas sp.]